MLSKHSKKVFFSLIISAGLTSSVFAQSTADDNITEINIDRSEFELNDRVAQIPLAINAFNTAVLLTSYDERASTVHCSALNARGNVIGRVKTTVPSHGVKLLFASDLTQGVDFLGKISCKSRGQVIGSAYLLGPTFSDLQVNNSSDRAGSFIRIPVALSR